MPELPLSLVSVAHTAEGSVGDGGGGPRRVLYLQLSSRTAISGARNLRLHRPAPLRAPTTAPGGAIEPPSRFAAVPPSSTTELFRREKSSMVNCFGVFYTARVPRVRMRSKFVCGAEKSIMMYHVCVFYIVLGLLGVSQHCSSVESSST